MLPMPVMCVAIAVQALWLFAPTSFAQSARSNEKIERCQRTKQCKFAVTFRFRGKETIEKTVLSFVVEQKLWKTFTEQDKMDLRVLLKEKLAEVQEHPERYVGNLEPSHPVYGTMLGILSTTRSYSVMPSDKHDTDGSSSVNFEKEILLDF